MDIEPAPPVKVGHPQALPLLPGLGGDPLELPPSRAETVDVPVRGPSLLVRVDQPVEGVEFQPHTLLRDQDGGVVATGNRRLEYSWLRSKARRTCEEPSCPKQREPALFQDLVTGRRYCSRRCMMVGFKGRNRGGLSKEAQARRYTRPEVRVGAGSAER
jgi:hypothetical protein